MPSWTFIDFNTQSTTTALKFLVRWLYPHESDMAPVNDRTYRYPIDKDFADDLIVFSSTHSDVQVKID